MYKRSFNYTLYIALSIMTYVIEADSHFLPEPAIMNNYNIIQLGIQFESNNSYIQYIQDIFNNQYLLKQKKRIPFNKMLLYAVRDIFASIIAHRLGVSLNAVWFIEPYKNFPGKKIAENPATLHTVVPGVIVASDRELSPKIRIKQWSAEKKIEGAGLTEQVIRSMGMHKDLAHLVAFDTLTSNADRHNGNLLYDRKTDKFYGIDMDSTFRVESKIVSCSCENVQKMIKDTTIVFSAQELDALRLYKQTLEHFLMAFSLAKLHSLADECFKKAGYIVKSKQDRTIALMHTVLSHNYAEIKRLILGISQLISAKRIIT